MGIEYALLCDKTHEAFELGKGAWYDWKRKLPKSCDEVREHLRLWLMNIAWEPPQGPEAWIGEVSVKIWAFIEAHPGCRVAGDTDMGEDDNYWDTEPWEPENVDGMTFYRQVGSRYSTDGL